MPHEKWCIELRARASARFLDRSRPEDFETFNQARLVDAIRQLSQLALFSERLFDELTTECQALVRRSSSLCDRVKQVQQRVTPLNAKSVRVRKYIAFCQSIVVYLRFMTRQTLFCHCPPTLIGRSFSRRVILVRITTSLFFWWSSSRERHLLQSNSVCRQIASLELFSNGDSTMNATSRILKIQFSLSIRLPLGRTCSKLFEFLH